MRICPGCRKHFEEDLNFCPVDGLPLIERSITFSTLSGDEEAPPDPAQLEGDYELQAGMMIGQYQVERVVAEGGMGVIYSGIQPVIRKRVGIKVLNKRYAQSPKSISRFVLEARSVNEIGHHNIVDIFSIGELDDGRNYMIMELLDGLTLHEILYNEQRLEPGQVLPVFDQLCNALEAAHEKGFVHRDLKPANIFVLRRPPHPFVKILDFGLAKLRGAVTGHETKVGTVLGTPEYMAPEQCRGDDVDPRADIYALGVMLYEMVTGRKPFFHASPFKVLLMQQQDPLPPPSRFVELSAALEAVITTALAKDRNKRFSTAQQLLTQLHRAVPQALPWTARFEPPAPAAPAGELPVTKLGEAPNPAYAAAPAPQAQLPKKRISDAITGEIDADEGATEVSAQSPFFSGEDSLTDPGSTPPPRTPTAPNVAHSERAHHSDTDEDRLMPESQGVNSLISADTWAKELEALSSQSSDELNEADITVPNREPVNQAVVFASSEVKPAVSNDTEEMPAMLKAEALQLMTTGQRDKADKPADEEDELDPAITQPLPRPLKKVNTQPLTTRPPTAKPSAGRPPATKPPLKAVHAVKVPAAKDSLSEALSETPPIKAPPIRVTMNPKVPAEPVKPPGPAGPAGPASRPRPVNAAGDAAPSTSKPVAAPSNELLLLEKLRSTLPPPPAPDAPEADHLDYAKTIPLSKDEIAHQMIKHSIPVDPESQPSITRAPNPSTEMSFDPGPLTSDQDHTFAQQERTLDGTLPPPNIDRDFAPRSRWSTGVKILFWIGLAVVGASAGAAIMWSI